MGFVDGLEPINRRPESHQAGGAIALQPRRPWRATDGAWLRVSHVVRNRNVCQFSSKRTQVLLKIRNSNHQIQNGPEKSVPSKKPRFVMVGIRNSGFLAVFVIRLSNSFLTDSTHAVDIATLHQFPQLL